MNLVIEGDMRELGYLLILTVSLQQNFMIWITYLMKKK